MVLKKKNILMATAGIAMAFNFSSCKKDKDDSQTDKLVGEWEIISIDGDPVDDDYFATFEFEADQDFSYCNEEEGYEKYCYTGEWEWGNDDKTEIDIELNDGGQTETAVFEIDKLTDDVLEGDIINDGDVIEYTFKKIN